MTSSLDEVIAQLTGDTGDTARTEAPPPAAAEAPAAAKDKVKPVYDHADAWVREVWVHLLGEYKRESEAGRGGGLRWCPRWWSHPLALSRLDSLWRAWEALRLDPGTGLSVWYRDHFAQALTDLCGAEGPFRRCGPGKHTDAEQAEAIPAPEAVIADFAENAPPVGPPPDKRRGARTAGATSAAPGRAGSAGPDELPPIQR